MTSAVVPLSLFTSIPESGIFWSTPAGTLFSIPPTQIVSYQLQATSIDAPITYTLELPDPNTLSWFFDLFPDGKLVTKGAYDPAFAPTWVTLSGVVGNFNDNGLAPITPVTLVANPAPSRSIVSYTIESGALPFGLVMETTGVIRGTPIQVGGGGVDPRPKPLWVSPASGNLVTLKESQTLTPITLTATPQTGSTVKYSIVKGNTPAGIYLTSAGVLRGIAPEVPGPVISGAPPSWVTPADGAIIGNFSENQTISDITLLATIGSGSFIATYSIVKGALPPGLFLNPATGVIRGATQEIPGATSTFPNAPTWTTSGSLGSFARGSAIAPVTLVTTGLNTRSYGLVSGQFPVGVYLSSDGTLRGTPNASQAAGTFTFTIRASVNGLPFVQDAFADQTLTMITT